MSPDLGYVALALALGGVHFVSEPARWWAYTGAAPGFLRLLQVFSLTALATYLAPLKLGLPLRLYLLNLRANLPLPRALALATVDGLLSYSLWGVGAAAAYGLLAHLEFRIANAGIIAAATVIVVILLSVLLAWRGRRARAPAASGRWLRFVEAVTLAMRETTLMALVLATLIMVVDVAALGARHWALAQALGQDLPLALAGAIGVLSVFAGLASMMPMGLGGYDIVLVALLEQAGVPIEVAIGVTLLNRLLNVTIALALGGWAGTTLGIRANRELVQAASSRAETANRR